MAKEYEPITADEAIDAITEADFVTEEGRHVIHTVVGGLGADWDTREAIRAIREDATELAWGETAFWGRCLGMRIPGSRVVFFDGVRQLPKSEKEARGE